jgi:hypothetical protein
MHIFKINQMKRITCIFLFILLYFTGFSQLMPARNTDALILANKVKTASSVFHDASSGKNHLIQKLGYDPKGTLTSEYLLSIWDVVSYSHMTTYMYDSAGKIVEIQKIQEILKLFERDLEYIESFGDIPVNEKTLFTYDPDGQIMKKEIFVFYSDILKPGSLPNQTITYAYENEKLVLEESASPESRIFNNNYTIQYDYDNTGRLIRNIRTYGKEKSLTRETRFVYDDSGILIEKVIIDAAAPHNNTHEKYEYDSVGNLINLYLFSNTEKIFELETTYAYDTQGRRISGDREVKFEYLDNGLLKSESWFDQKADQQITFTTTYEYY